MRSFALLVVLVVLVLIAGLALTPEPARAAEPPNRNDPCAVAGKNTCGTNGVGFHATYRYGVRWFGDYKGVVPGAGRGFCIDLRFWYPAARHAYRELTGKVLRNREGKVVPVAARRKLAYAIWAYGRSSKPAQQAAVMLYVHALMDDARPGEVDPQAIGPEVARIYARIARDAGRYHGPYRVVVKAPAKLRVGDRGTATVRVLSASGSPVPNATLAVAAKGATGAPTRARTGAGGAATVRFVAAKAGTARLDVTARDLPSTLPRIYAPTTAAAEPNGQRLAIPASQTVVGRSTTAVSRSTVTVRTEATPSVVAVGEETRDRVTIENVAAGWSVAVRVSLHGPFRTVDAIRCDRPPAWQSTFTTNGPGAYTTPPARLERPGWYVYQLVVPADAAHGGLTTPCGDARERVKVEAQPRVRTEISDRTATLAEPVFDRIVVSGLGGETATVHAFLYGPFPTRDAIACDGKPVWRGSVRVTGDGEYRTAPVRLKTPGWYTYVERIDAGGFVRAAETACGEVAETTLARARPTVTTVASAEVVLPGGALRDRVRVEGLGTTPAQVEVRLFGPFPTRAAIRCTGTPLWTGRLAVRGDGVYRTAPVTIDTAGIYAFQERLLDQTLVEGSVGECGAVSETAVARPLVLTGRGDPATRRTQAKEPSAAGLRPTRVRLPARGIDAPAVPVGIDVELGALAAPADIRKLGWWVDGRPAGASSGATLIAGHVDSLSRGAGAFFRLREARPGDLVQVDVAGGRTVTYRVTSVRTYEKRKLPLSLYSRSGRPRLVLVTCGGPFLERERAYRDNVVVTAVPA